MAMVQILGAAYGRSRSVDEENAVSIPPLQRRKMIRVVEHTDTSNDGAWQDRALIRLVVETDVSTDDRHAHGSRRVSHAFDRLLQLPGTGRAFRISEVEAVR